MSELVPYITSTIATLQSDDERKASALALRGIELKAPVRTAKIANGTITTVIGTARVVTQTAPEAANVILASIRDALDVDKLAVQIGYQALMVLPISPSTYAKIAEDLKDLSVDARVRRLSDILTTYVTDTGALAGVLIKALNALLSANGGKVLEGETLDAISTFAALDPVATKLVGQMIDRVFVAPEAVGSDALHASVGEYVTMALETGWIVESDLNGIPLTVENFPKVIDAISTKLTFTTTAVGGMFSDLLSADDIYAIIGGKMEYPGKMISALEMLLSRQVQQGTLPTMREAIMLGSGSGSVLGVLPLANTTLSEADRTALTAAQTPASEETAPAAA